MLGVGALVALVPLYVWAATGSRVQAVRALRGYAGFLGALVALGLVGAVAGWFASLMS